MIEQRVALFAVVMLTGVVADVLMARELTLRRRLGIMVEWSGISLAATWLTPAGLSGPVAQVAAVIGGGRVVGWAVRTAIAWARVEVATRRVERRLEIGD